MKILIITGGRIDHDSALRLLKEETFDHIIVVDGSLAFWDEVVMKEMPEAEFDQLVGDFDTISPEILDKYINRADITVHRFNPVKDNTDTDIAVRLALQLGEGGPLTVYLIGAFGTRVDHTLSTLQLLVRLKNAGAEGIIIGAKNRVRLLRDETAVLQKKKQYGRYVSLIPVSEKLTGLHMTGFKYEVDGAEETLGDSLCVSNEITAESGEITIGKGTAFLIESAD